MKETFPTLKPFYFWQHNPYTQWATNSNQFIHTHREAMYGGNKPHIEAEIMFSSTEQWMMWQKALLFSDYATAKEILATTEPRDVKALGRKVKNFREDLWNKKRLDVVYAGNMLKFSQNPEWAEQLKDVVKNGQFFVESSPYDKVWGIGINTADAKAGKAWNGDNLLGIVLTNVAIDLIKAEQFVMYQEDVNYAGVPATDALQAYLKQFIDVDLYPNWDAIENDFTDLVSKFVEERWGIGEFRHHH